MADERTPLPRARLNKALARGFRNAYDSLGYVVTASFGTFLVSAILLTLSGLAAKHVNGPVWVALVLLAMLAAWLCEVGILYFARKSVYEGHAMLSDTWEGIARLLRPAIALFAADLAISIVLASDAIFFLTLFRAKGGSAFAALGVFSAYLTLVWLMMSLYHLPLLIAQLEMESGPRVWVILRKSFLLMADNPGFTLGLFVVIIAFAVLCALPGLLGIAILFPGAAAFLLTCALRELFVKYGVVEEEPDVVDEKPWKLPGN